MTRNELVDGNGPIWTMLLALMGACVWALAGQSFSVQKHTLLLPSLGLSALAGAALMGRSTNRPRLAAGATAFLQMTLFTIIGVVLSYALAARAGGLWDSRLAAADRLLGADWPAFFHAADQYPIMLWIGAIAYHSLPLQMVICIVALSATRAFDALRSAVIAAVMSGSITILTSGLFPAMGNVFDPKAYSILWPSVAWLEQDLLSGLRSGTYRALDLTHLWGIVTFPSFHATLPIILAWASRDTPWLRSTAPIWAGLTILATPLFGGHYAVDVLAGVALAPLAIFFASNGFMDRQRFSPTGGIRTQPRPAMKFVVRIQSERRSAERQAVTVGTVIQTEPTNAAIVLLDEVSAAGFRVVAAVPLAVGEQIDIELPAIGVRTASVVHQTGMRFGCSFNARLTDEELSQIVAAGAAQHELRKERAAAGWKPGVTPVAA